MNLQSDLIELLYRYSEAGLDPVFLAELPQDYLHQMHDQIQKEPASTSWMAVTKHTALHTIEKHYFGEHDQRQHGNRYGEGEHMPGDSVQVNSPFHELNGQNGRVIGKHTEHPGKIKVRFQGGRTEFIDHTDLNNERAQAYTQDGVQQPYAAAPGPNPHYYGRDAYHQYGWSRPGDHVNTPITSIPGHIRAKLHL